MRIPDVKGVARSVPAVQSQLVRSNPYEGLGEALEGLGRAAEREVDERASYQTAQARSAFIKSRIEQDSAFEEDLDYADLPERYEEGLRKSLSTVSEQIKNPRARAMFEEEQQVRIAEGKARQALRASGIERDTERARVSESLNGLNEAGLGSEDPLEMFAEVGSLLESAVEAGYYTAEEAGRTERVWKDTFAANKISLMEPDKRLEALELPWAQNIPTVVREKLREEAERDGRSARAIESSEQFWADTGGDYNAALKLAAKIKDTDDRLAVEGRLTTMRTRQDQQEREQNRENVRAGWEVLEQGGGLEDIDSGVWAALDPQERIQMRSWISAQARAAAAGSSRVTDLNAYNDVYSFLDTDDATGALSYLNANYDKFSESDYRSLRSKISGTFEDPGLIESSRSLTQSVSSAIDRAGLKGDETKGELLLEYDRLQQDYQREHGEDPSDQWRDEAIEGLAAKYKITKSGWFNDKTSAAYEVEKIGTVPQRHTQAVLNAFGSVDSKTTISEEKLGRSYSMAMAYFRWHGMSNPSDEAITEMIKAQQAAQE